MQVFMAKIPAVQYQSELVPLLTLFGAAMLMF
jgi:hypothetical protein